MDWSDYRPRLRAIISFWISVVPPMMDWMQLSIQAQPTACSASGTSRVRQRGLHQACSAWRLAPIVTYTTPGAAARVLTLSRRLHNCLPSAARTAYRLLLLT
jgi:hypothetical protein